MPEQDAKTKFLTAVVAAVVGAGSAHAQEGGQPPQVDSAQAEANAQRLKDGFNFLVKKGGAALGAAKDAVVAAPAAAASAAAAAPAVDAKTLDAAAGIASKIGGKGVAKDIKDAKKIAGAAEGAAEAVKPAEGAASAPAIDAGKLLDVGKKLGIKLPFSK